MLEEKKIGAVFFVLTDRSQGHKPSNAKVHVPMLFCKYKKLKGKEAEREMDFGEGQKHSTRNLGLIKLKV